MRVFYNGNFIFNLILFCTLSLSVAVNAFDFERKPPIRGSCSANFTEPEGTFSSMNFPDNPYPALANCSWKIEVCLCADILWVISNFILCSFSRSIMENAFV